ncbi:hypothetical protein N0V84_000927 [Fusarium piperis]|uniref:Peptidase A2 domain-containing protein n=1 Tax=Fusarium piperis TaxID=1435070 RepID=A0A9W8WM08_9HYPO|nr:hypothetical protein N0V84_000927 [Fusarium piperis]
MPTSIGEIVISPTIPNQAGQELEVVVGLLDTGAKIAILEQSETDLRAQPVVSMSYLETVVIGEGQKSPDEGHERNTVLHVDWETDADFFSGSSLRPKTPPGNAAIDHHVVLARGAALHIRSCINNISRDDEGFDPSALTGYRKHLYEWMNGYNSSEATKMLLADVSMISAIEILSSLPKLGVEGDLLSTIGPNLISIVKGDMDPLPLLLEKGRLSQVQENIETGRKLGVHISHYLSFYAIKRPRMKILEIGSGTGYHTGDILKAFEGRNIQSYDLTDVSLSLLQQLKSSYSQHEGVNFKALDINQDPLGQGFDLDSYDVVIVNNVLRIANSLDEAVRNARKLLVPGGALVFLGMTDPSPAYGLIFGMMESMWSSQHSDQLPLPSPAEWEHVLSVNSFSGLEPATKTFDRVGQSCYCVISTALASTTRKRMPINIITNTEGKLLNFAGQFSSILAINGMASSISGLQHKIAPESLYVVLDEGSDPLLANPSSARFSELKTLALKAKSVLWVSMRADGANSTSGADMNMVTGFTRVARKENESLKLVSLVVKQDSPANLDILRVMLRIMEISFHQQRSPTCELEYEYSDGRVLVPRVRAAASYQQWVQSKTDETTTDATPFFSLERPLRMEIATPGLLSSIRFTDDEPRGVLGPWDVEIKAKAYGVNSTDVDTALGHVSERLKSTAVSEWAGIITAVGVGLHEQWKVGDRVFGLGGTAPFASNPSISNPALIRKMPSSMTFSETVSLLTAFVAAYHALINVARLENGQSVLIHAADEPTGQAAIMISQMMGAKIFATVKDSTGGKLIREMFQIPESHIFSSQSSIFRQGVMRQTAEKEVDVILSFLGGSKFEDSWACLAEFGTFVDIGYGDSPFTMTTTEKNAVFASLNLGLLVHHRPHVVGEVLDKAMELFQNKRLRLVSPLIKMPITDIEEAFRLHSKGQGKIILDIADGALVKATVPRPAPLRLSSDAAYVIAGGLGNIGLKICPLLASHGAKHIVALSRSGATRHSGHREALEKELEALGAKLYLHACDITDGDKVQEVAKWCEDNLPPVRGVIQSATVFQDGTLENMDAQLFNGAVRPKRIGTLNLHSAFASDYLDFFVMVSSAAAILGTKGQAHYNSGNSFEEGFARQQLAAGSKTHFTTIMPALIGGSDADTTGPDRRSMLFRQGATIVEFEEVISMVEYAVGTQAPRDGYSQLIVGIDPNAIPNDGTYNYPFFTDILQTKDTTTLAEDEVEHAPATLSQKLAVANTPQETHDVLSEAVTTKIRELIAIGPDDTSQVLDASSIVTLTDTILKKSKVISDRKLDDTGKTVNHSPTTNGSATNGTTSNGSVPVQKPDKSQELVQINGHPKHGFDCCAASEELPILPLLDLDTVLGLNFGAIKHLLTPPELEHIVTLLQRLGEPGGIGRKLHARLMDRFKSPSIDNWLFKPYLETNFTGRNYPVSPFSTFAGSDILSKFPHRQAERAAIISLAALEFKQKLENGRIEPIVIGGRPQCMYLHGWLFNSFREALPGIDEMRKMPSENYIAVLRRGHLFKVNLTDDQGQHVSFSKLESTFQAILDKVEDESWVGILTADERDSWAEAIFKNLSPDSKRYLDMVEGAAFIVSLDDGAPNTPFERMKSWQLSDGFNRWFDKGLKFAVCSNGVSGSVVEHSMIDSMTVRELYDATSSAILNYRRDGPDTLDSRNGVDEVKLEEYTYQSSPAIEERITHVRARYLQETSIIGFITWECVNFGQEYLQLHKVPAKGIFETMVQLASKYFLGENHPCWSAISMGHAHKGRPEIIQTYTAELKASCDAADDSSIMAQKRQTLLFAAARSHVANVNRVQQGKGYERTMSAMQTVLKDDEVMPEIYNDPTYINMRPHWLMTGSTDLGGSAGGEFSMVLRYPDSVWVQYVVDAASAKFSIVTGRDRTERFCECMESAAKLIHELLEVD